MGRNPCCSKEGLNRGAWTAREDKILRDYITVHGEGRWRDLPEKAGLKRCGKSCRLRWLNYLRPDIKRGNISPDEEELIIRLHKLLGNRWSLIAGRLPGRTDNEIKNYWNTNLVKRVQHQSTISASTPPKSSKQSQPPLKMGSHVIKTKAIKCSKVFINPDSDKNIQQFCNNPYDTAAAAAADNNQPFESDRYNKNPSDLLMDLNLGADFTFSDLLNSDFSSSSDHLPLVFTDEMLQDNFWMAAIDSTTENATSYLNSFDSFL